MGQVEADGSFVDAQAQGKSYSTAMAVLSAAGSEYDSGEFPRRQDAKVLARSAEGAIRRRTQPLGTVWER